MNTNPEKNPFEIPNQTNLESAKILPFSKGIEGAPPSFSVESGNGKYLFEQAIEGWRSNPLLQESLEQSEVDLLLDGHLKIEALYRPDEYPEVKQHCKSWLTQHTVELNNLVVRILKSQTQG